MSEKKSFAKKKASTKKASVVKQPKIVADDAKLRKKPKYKSFRYHKRVKHHEAPLPSWWMLTRKAFKLLSANKRRIAWFFLVYGLLYIVFVRGFTAPVDIDAIRDSFESVATEEVSALAANFTVFSLMVQSTSSAAGDVAGLYQMFFLIISALALIWLFRQQQAGNKVTMKMAFYRGMYPLIPFIIITAIIGLQTIPASAGNFLFKTVIDSGLAVNTLEQTVWLILFLLMLLLSLYMISSSLIALFIVTLPEMTPLLALKKAKELVQFRRFSVLRKVLAILLFILVLFVAVVFPLIFVSADIAQLVFFALTILVIPFAVAYLFVLYRELL